MDGELRFYTVAVVAVLIGFVSLVSGCSVSSINSSKEYYAAVKDCTAAGGQWMPTNASGTCFRR